MDVDLQRQLSFLVTGVYAGEHLAHVGAPAESEHARLVLERSGDLPLGHPTSLE